MFGSDVCLLVSYGLFVNNVMRYSGFRFASGLSSCLGLQSDGGMPTKQNVSDQRVAGIDE
jgi:hypothetical protein